MIYVLTVKNIVKINVENVKIKTNVKIMSKIQKTFYEDDDVSNPLTWVNEVVWDHTNTIKDRDPAEWKYELSNKIKITIEIFGDEQKDT